MAEDEEGNDPTMVLVYIRQLMVANRSMIAVGWQKLKVEYPDVTLHHLEAILTIREDFQTKEVRAVLPRVPSPSLPLTHGARRASMPCKTPVLMRLRAAIGSLRWATTLEVIKRCACA